MDETDKYWAKMQNALEHSIRKSFNACQSAIIFWRSNIEEIYIFFIYMVTPVQDLPKSFVMVFTVKDAYVPLPKFTKILKVISECLM